MEVVLFHKLFGPQIDFQANVRDFWTQTSQNRPKWLGWWLIRWLHRIRRGRFTPACHRHASEGIDHLLRPLPSSSARRGLLGWVGLPSENTARISRCGALEHILTLLQVLNANQGVFAGSGADFRGSCAECLLRVRQACADLCLLCCCLLRRASLLPGRSDGLLGLPGRRGCQSELRSRF